LHGDSGFSVKDEHPARFFTAKYAKGAKKGEQEAL
jgi:hypothetical protein